MVRYRVPRIGGRQRPLPAATFSQVKAARQRLESDRGDPDALFTLAAWEAVAGDPWEAIALLHRLTRTHPKYPGAWRLKARVYRELGQERMAALCDESDRRYSEEWGDLEGGEDPEARVDRIGRRQRAPPRGSGKESPWA